MLAKELRWSKVALFIHIVQPITKSRKLVVVSLKLTSIASKEKVAR